MNIIEAFKQWEYFGLSTGFIFSVVLETSANCALSTCTFIEDLGRSVLLCQMARVGT